MILRAFGWATAVLALLAAAGIASTRAFGYDLAVYLAGAQRLLRGEELYPLAATPHPVWTNGAYLYPPTTALAFVPLALLPQPLATFAWTAVLAAIAAVLGYALVSPLARDARPWAAAAYVLYLPLVAEITLGNLNLVTLGLCLVAWHWRGRPLRAGAAFAVALGAKLLPLALGPFYVGARAGRTIAAFAAVAVAAVVVTLPFLGDAWTTYARLMWDLTRVPAEQTTTLAPAAVRAVPLALPLAAALLALVAGHTSRDPRRAPRAFATALAAVPLAAPGIWYPYLVFALPLLGHLARRPRRWEAAGLGLAYAALEIPKRPDGPDVAFYGLLLLIAVGVAGPRRHDG